MKIKKIALVSGMEAIYTFNGDGAGTGTLAGIAVDITYTIDGNTCTIVSSGATSTLTYDNGELKGTSEGSDMTSVFSRI